MHVFPVIRYGFAHRNIVACRYSARTETWFTKWYQRVIPAEQLSVSS